MKQKLDFSSFEKALGQLKKSVQYLRSELAKNDPDLHQQFRSATIQSFEYTFELAYKMIKRKLERIAANPSEIDQLDYKGLIRQAAEAGLINDPQRFFNYREKRNITAHTYDANKAEEIISVIDGFVSDMEFLIKALARNNS